MKKEIFEDALTGIDERHLIQAAEPAVGRRRTIKKWKLLPIAAALLLAAALGISAAAPVNIGFYLKAAFGGGYTLLNKPSDDMDNEVLRACDDQLDVELTGIIGDSNSVWLYLDITVAPGIDISGQNISANFEIDAGDVKLVPSNNGRLYSPWFLGQTANEDGSTTIHYRIALHTEGDVRDHTIGLRCTGITVWNGYKVAANVRKPVSGSWDLRFPLNYKPMYVDIQTNQTVTDSGTSLDGVEIRSVLCSSHHISVHYYSESIKNTPLHRSLFPGDTFKLVLKDGRVLEGTHSKLLPIRMDSQNRLFFRTFMTQSSYGHLLFQFTYPIDPHQAASLWIGDFEIPLQ